MSVNQHVQHDQRTTLSLELGNHSNTNIVVHATIIMKAMNLELLAQKYRVTSCYTNMTLLTNFG